MSYPPQGGGVATFLGLTDTPAAYAGEAGKAALVNAGEAALEFGTIASPEIAPVYDDTIIFGPAAKNDNWEDLDCGVGQALVYLDVELVGVGGAGSYTRFRPNGEALDLTAEGVHRAAFNGARLGYILMVTDAAGLVEWRSTAGINVTIRRRAYWPNAPAERVALYTAEVGVTPAYGEYQFGKANALVLVLLEPAIGGQIYGRTRGEARACGQGGASWCSGGAAGLGNVILLKTDGDGIAEMSWGGNMNIWRLSYITKFTEYGNAAFGVGVPLPAAYTDLDCGMGQGILYLSLECTLAGGIMSSIRQNGSALDVLFESQVSGVNVTLPEIGYAFVLVDQNGIVEWKGDTFSEVTLRRLGACR